MSFDETVDIEKVVLDRLEYACLQTFPQGMLNDLRVEGSNTLFFMADQFAVRVTTSLLGLKGEPQPYVEHVQIPNFPRWLPKFLRRRWTKMKWIEMDATPWIVFPEMTWKPPSSFGSPSRTVVWTRPDD